MHFPKHYDIVIIGGSYMGLTVALMLSKLNLKVAVLEKQSLKFSKKSSEPSRLLAIAKASMESYYNYSIKNLFEHDVEPITYIRVLEEETSAYLDFDPEQVGLSRFGVMIEEYTLLKRLYTQASEVSNIFISYNAQINNIYEEGYKNYVELENGEKLSASLVIACDGKNSWVRRFYGIGVQTFNYHQSAIVCDIAHAKNHEGVAVEKFMPQGPFAILPKPGGFTSSIVWTCEARHAEAISSLDQETIEEIIKSKFGDHLGDIQIITDIKFFPLSLVHAKQYVGNRLALIGDAAHAIHPISGQGLNLGIRDAEKLVELIRQNLELGLDIGSQLMLKEYKQTRTIDNNIMIEATHHLNLLFSNDISLIKLLRGIGLKTVGNMPLLKKTFMQYAMGIL